ncbi:septum formation initiator family protein [Amphiplicatus metriothermophilus]|uniref:Cell division protein FtsB n=1 Tax=Amphiplicatus metriothermophilus TaxID=1519374 RepID=A0A239PZP0_9PROT|nr:septum formation initiator family protein [Amphiplicatus metriothermophilus]MBB5520145.1 cell division protein FtsB [Amphiplicatus metriothermophilus]SNT75734.1 Cell division protein FtsB [Amphiplicatus metriothermophilus]
MRVIFRFIKDIAAPVLLACWVVYLAYGAVAGAAGYRALGELEAEAARERAALAALRARREALEKRADLLNPRSLDPDLVDERVRAVLGYARPGDVVVPRDELDRMLRAEKTEGK